MMATLAELIRTYGEPPVKVEEIIGRFGLRLEKSAVLPDGISGQLVKTSDGFSISVQGKDHYFRRRFTMAHELAHFLLHKDLIGTGVNDNTAFRSDAGSEFFNPKIGAREETEANQLASRLLMPKDLVEAKWQDFRVSPDAVKSMATKFQVSPKAMEIRLKSLGLI